VVGVSFAPWGIFRRAGGRGKPAAQQPLAFLVIILTTGVKKFLLTYCSQRKPWKNKSPRPVALSEHSQRASPSSLWSPPAPRCRPTCSADRARPGQGLDQFFTRQQQHCVLIPPHSLLLQPRKAKPLPDSIGTASQPAAQGSVPAHALGSPRVGREPDGWPLAAATELRGITTALERRGATESSSVPTPAQERSHLWHPASGRARHPKSASKPNPAATTQSRNALFTLRKNSRAVLTLL